MTVAAVPWSPPAAGEVDALERGRQRLSLLLLIFLIAVFLVVLRLAHLAVMSPGEADGAATARGHRAAIVDRNGVMLAQRYEAYALTVRPRELVGDPEVLAPRIAAVVGGSPARIEATLRRKASFAYIARRVRPAVAQAAMRLGEPGIEVAREPDRIYPQISLAAHVLGQTDLDGRGTAGIEARFEERLAARPDAPLALAIDARVQQVLESELQAGMDRHTAVGAAGVIMDARTGEVLALASLPAFNPNRPGVAEADARFNRSTLGVYELGSTFKALTIAMALDSGTTSMTRRYDARFPIRVARFRINDDHPKSRWLSVPEVFIYSSNIGTAKMAEEVGAERQRAYMDKLGFLKPVEVELKETGRPLYPTDWGRIATMTVGYGHGIAVTPLHLAASYAALVNGGIYRAPTLLKQDGPPRAGERVFTEHASLEMRRLMRLVVTKGTGRRADAPGYRVGGKTGTAEKPMGGRYERDAVIATFAGAFPMDDPRYVVVTTLDTPHGTKETYGFRGAGWVSAPVTRRVVERIGPLLGVRPDAAREIDLAGLLPEGEVKAAE